MSFFCHGAEEFQARCRAILGNNPGSIIVYDLLQERPIAVVNPNTAFRRSFRPGSLFKLITAAALLERGRLDPREKRDCRNHFSLSGRAYTCSVPGGHGPVNLAEALGQSCAVYFHHFSPRLTPGEIKKTAALAGIGRPLPIPGGGTTAAGRCDPPGDPRDFLYFCVGESENVQVTPWHGVNLTAIAARGRPIAACGMAAPFKPATLMHLRQGMERAAWDGTCAAIGKAGIDGAGKTGTAANPSLPGRTLGWFCGYMPGESPRFVVVVLVEDGKGYADAVPIAVKVMKELNRTRPGPGTSPGGQ
jgi:cell division protein FtsI/penicillin-binding protein 2